MTKQEFLQELADILNEDPADVQPATEVESLAGWDSTGLLGLIAFLDDELGMTVNVDKLRDCKTVQDLMDMAGDELE